MKRHRRLQYRWYRLGFGLALGATAGVVLGHAWTAQSATWWWIGAITGLSGVLLVLSGFYVRQAVSTNPLMLGQLLVNEYGLIREGDLAHALIRQHQTKQSLGKVLVEMGLISPAKLAEVLEYQISAGESEPDDSGRGQ